MHLSAHFFRRTALPSSILPPLPFLFSRCLLLAFIFLSFSFRVVLCGATVPFSFAQPCVLVCTAFSLALRRTTGTTMTWTTTSASSLGQSSRRRGRWGRRQANPSHNRDRSIEENEVEKQARHRTAWIREFIPLCYCCFRSPDIVLAVCLCGCLRDTRRVLFYLPAIFSVVFVILFFHFWVVPLVHATFAGPIVRGFV